MQNPLRRCMRSTALAVIAALGLAPSVARATMLQFEFSTLVDATAFGLSASEPLLIRYRYDPFTVPLVAALGTPVVVRHLYGPVVGTFQVGGHVVRIEGQLSVDDENSGHDSYNFYAANNVANTSVSGSVNGTSIHGFSLYLLDQAPPLTMLSSLDPPATTGFAAQATLVRATFRDFLNQKVVQRDFAPAELGLYSFTVPEPGVAASGVATAGALGALLRRRRGSEA